MKAWFYSKEPLERRIVIAVGAMIILSLLYLLVWVPVSESYDLKSKQLNSKRELVQWMQKTAARITRLQGDRTAKGASSNHPLLSTVDQTIKRSGLGSSMKRLEPQGNNKVQIWFENAGFDPLVSWLGNLSGQYQISIVTISIEPQGQPGRVNARLVLSRGAS